MTILRRTLVGTAAAALAASPAAAAPAGPRVRLRLLETSDLHMFARDFDYYRDRTDATVGLSKVAGLIDDERRGAANALLFDNGDIIQGSPLGDYIARPRGLPPGAVHPFLRAMNLLGYAAATVGNHEFNFGLGFLERSLAGAAFPFVCANVRRATGSRFLPPYTILRRTLRDEAGNPVPLRIGVIGFVTPQIMTWDRAKLQGRLAAYDIVDAARRYLPSLRANCDLVIALSHSGISANPRAGGEENASLYLAAEPGFDAILTGHSHRVFPGPDYAGREGVDADRGTLHGVPAVMPGYWGSHLGVIDLVLERRGAAWAVADFTVRARPIYQRAGGSAVSLVEADGRIEAAVAEAHEGTRKWVGRPVGRIARPLTSYFALVGDDSVVNLVNEAQRRYAARLLAGTKAAALPILSAASIFKAGGLAPDYYLDIPAGPVAMRDVAEIYLYPNTLVALKVTGAVVQEWLERSACVFLRLDPAVTEPQPLIDRRMPAYNFDVISGLTWTIDLSRPARYDGSGKVTDPDARRIVDLRFSGAPIDPAAQFVVVTNNYRADGGGGFPGLAKAEAVLRAPDANRDTVLRYLGEEAELAIDPAAAWRFAPLPGVTAVFEGSPAGKRLLAERPDVKWSGSVEGGWERFALTL
jgi:2',3'-cyclic-nucleotide 2'-phosphodiesterase/3'-nucleotidase